jgi:putative phosphoesterase
MTLLILSDSHGRPDHIREAIRRVKPDGILFAGDGLRDLTACDLPAPPEGCPLWAVSGNCDWLHSPLIIGGSLFEALEEELITWEGIRILLMHGHRHGVKGGPGQAIACALSRNADVLVFGHTHVPLELHLSPDRPRSDLAVTKPLSVFNPGSLGDRNASFGTLTVKDGRLLFGHGEL